MNYCFCGKKIMVREAHNAKPLRDEYSCKECNVKAVIPLRLFLFFKNRKGNKMDSALWVKTDGVKLLKPHGEYFTLEELQTAVGGYIETIASPLDGCIAVVNEDGLLKGLPRNTLYEQMFGRRLVGNVLIVPAEIFEAPEQEEN